MGKRKREEGGVERCGEERERREGLRDVEKRKREEGGVERCGEEKERGGRERGGTMTAKVYKCLTCHNKAFPCHTIVASPSAGITVEPHRRQLHVTLAHQYLPEHHSTLEDLARTMVDPQAPARWELRLYSRDYRLAASEVSVGPR